MITIRLTHLTDREIAVTYMNGTQSLKTKVVPDSNVAYNYLASIITDIDSDTYKMIENV